MLSRKFDSPIEEALAATLHNRLASAVYAALRHAIRYHEDGDQAEELREHWRQVGAWAVSEDLIRSAQTDWPPEQWDFPRIFCIHPENAQFLAGCTQADIVARVRLWLDGVALDQSIDPDPCVEDAQLRRLKALHSGLNRTKIAR
jgi:hypothetical protein